MKLNRFKHKPSWYTEAEWRWEFADYGYIYLPYADESQKILLIEKKEVFDRMAAMLKQLNQPSRWQKLVKKLKKSSKQLPPMRMTAFDLAISRFQASQITPSVLIQEKSRGKVIKHTSNVEFNPNRVRTGGRVVKVMPRQLQKIKEAQEKFERDSTDGPSIEDLED